MPELAWATMMDTVCRLAIAHFKVGPSLLNLAHYEGFPPNWLLWPLILEDEINILFGDGGNGKSLIAMAAAVSLQTQNSMLSGMVPNGNVKTMYLDWEASPNAHASRLKKHYRQWFLARRTGTDHQYPVLCIVGRMGDCIGINTSSRGGPCGHQAVDRIGRVSIA